MKLVTGDNVKVISGNHKGKTGEITRIITKTGRAVVKGVNIVSKHVKPGADNPNGGIEKIEAPIDISNLMLIDPKSGEPTRVGRKPDDKGKLKRYSKKSGEFI